MDARTLLDWWTFTLSPSGWAILLVALLVVSGPLLLHFFWFNSASSTNLPSFLLVGPSGAGKTSLLTLVRLVPRCSPRQSPLTLFQMQFERGAAASTHTSQAPLSVECTLPVSTDAASNRFRSSKDPGAKYHRSFLLVDTPGHGKLRHFAMGSLVNAQQLKGIIFVVDSATLGSSETANSSLPEATAYLYDVLLTLQKRSTNAKSSRAAAGLPVLIAANKLDLFTSLPTKLVKNALEAELAKLRNTKSKGLLDSGVDVDDSDDRETLGGGGEGDFKFSLMEEYNVPVEVLGGSVVGSGAAADVQQWWDWIGRHL